MDSDVQVIMGPLVVMNREKADKLDFYALLDFYAWLFDQRSPLWVVALATL